MITATCRTCHQDWTVETLRASILIGLTRVSILKAPCGHGVYQGTLSLLGTDQEDRLEEAAFTWEWYDEAYFAAQAAVEQFHKEHPRPALDRWNPSPQRITCVCGHSLVLEATEIEGWDEGWEGICPECGLLWRVMDPKNRTPYSRARLQRYELRLAAWQRSRPKVVEPLTVECLQENAGGEPS